MKICKILAVFVSFTLLDVVFVQSDTNIAVAQTSTSSSSNSGGQCRRVCTSIGYRYGRRVCLRSEVRCR